MNRFSIWDILTGILLLGVLCLGCGFVVLLFSPTPLMAAPSVPTITQVVLPTNTLAVAPRALPPTWTPTPTREAAAPIGPGRTPRPTSTLAPTNTLFVAFTPTPLPTYTPTVTATRADANCYVIAESPLDNAEFQPNQEFTKVWTLKNNSGRTWQTNASDFRFVDGTRMQTGSDVYDLPRDVPHSGTIDFSVRMRAPSSAGTYTGNWSLVADGSTLCRFFVKIVVK